ncbi:uncharacterized protein LOC109363770 [Meleagris gallopavo]|uniref:uncharacterized protein LOC109363770 n=1 Tax=Meleagris gallopavo TaxID=9103 RepID=UPI00093900DD|nr:uncharacterized protein LOC109363770 [Meleagris gallopavo]
MVDDSFLLVPITLFFLYGLLFMVARFFLLTTIRHLKEMVAARSSSTRDRPWILGGGVEGPGGAGEAGQPALLQLPQCPERAAEGASAPQSGADRQMGRPRCSCPSCSRCSKADQELQQLVLSALPEHAAAPGPGFWEVAWRDLAELVERGSLSRCSSHSSWTSTGRNKDSLNVHQGASTEQVPVCAPGHVQTGMAHTNSGTQQSWLRSFLLRGVGFFWRETKLAQTKNQGGKASSRAVGDSTKYCFSSWPPPAEDCILRENILLPDGRLPQRPDNLVPPPEWAVNPPALRSSYTEAAGVATRRSAPICRDVGTSDREENCQCSYGAQHSTDMGSAKERGRAYELHAGTCSCTVPPQLGTVAHENIMQTGAAIRWWEQNKQQPVGLCTCPPEVLQKHGTIRPPAAAPSCLAPQGECRSAASECLSTAIGGWRSTEQPFCTCMHSSGKERLHQANQGQSWWDNSKARKRSALSESSPMFWGGCITAESERNAEKAGRHCMRKLHWYVH